MNPQPIKLTPKTPKSLKGTPVLVLGAVVLLTAAATHGLGIKEASWECSSISGVLGRAV